MSLIAILLMSIALSMDAFAVSITKGMTIRNAKIKLAFKIALFFGIFQGIMPLIGWSIGISFESYIKAYDHWIALILLSFLGFKMIFESIKNKSEKNNELSMDFKKCYTNITTKDLIMLSIATSIDALVVGISFTFLNKNIVFVVFLISITTFIFCFIGVLIGKKIGPIFKNYSEIMGGVILILIGLNIFNDHTNLLLKLFS